MNIQIVEHESAADFLDSSYDWLSQHEILNHGVISLAGVLTPQNPIYYPPFLFIHVTVDGNIAGCCIYAEPDGLVVSQCTPDIAPILFDYLQAKIHIPSRIFGPETPAARLAMLFGELRETRYSIHSTWRIHFLDRPVVDTSPFRGHIQIGKLDDVDLIRKWGKDYDEERPANVNIQQFLLKKLRDNHLYLWIDEEPKSLATISGVNCSGPRISAVYTPPSYRTHGHATALVQELSNLLLASGSAYVTLHTQAGDPVERIYKRLGYDTVGEKVSIIFQDV